MSEDAQAEGRGCLAQVIQGLVLAGIIVGASLLSGEASLKDFAIPGWVRNHWSSLTMLVFSGICTWSLFAFLGRRQSLSQRLGVPDWAVTVWEQQARERENTTLVLLVVALFAAALVIWVMEFFAGGWGGWFTVLRWVATVAHALVSLMLSFTFWRGP